MENIIVSTENKSYPIYFVKDFEGFGKAVERAELLGRKVCIITDDNVSPLYIDEFKKVCLNVFNEVFVYTFKAGEQNKNMETITKFYDFFMENKLDRKSVVIGLGGGVCGDMAGFAAATYMRGIKFVQVPTTLLSQVDSSVGGKVGIDYNGSKNIIGAFYQPEFVYINIDTLKTLPKREYGAGLAEVIKYGPIYDEDFYNFIKENKEKIEVIDEEVIKKVISRCCEIKADVVSQDEKESGLREILNFGHTIGHAIETVKNFGLLHGECVGIGMKAALYISFKRGYINEDIMTDVVDLLEYFEIPVSCEEVTAEEIYKQMFHDKKVKDNKIGFVLIKKFGLCERTTDVTKEEIISAIEYVIE